MKKLLKMIGIAVMVMLMMSASVFADESLEQIYSYGSDGYDDATFSQAAQSYHSQLDAASDEEYDAYIEYYVDYPDLVNGFETYKTFKASGDTFVGYGPYALYQTGEGDARIYQVMQYENGYYCLVCGFDSALSFNYLNIYSIKNLAAEDEMPATFDILTYELKELGSNGGAFFVFDGEVLKGALGNTIIGLGVVFSVLIFISIIISLFKFISPEGRTKKTKIDFLEDAEDENSVVSVTPTSNTADNELVAAISAAVITDETQLVAAIAAAIAAYEGVSTDSFVVKTIKKRKW